MMPKRLQSWLDLDGGDTLFEHGGERALSDKQVERLVGSNLIYRCKSSHVHSRPGERAYHTTTLMSMAQVDAMLGMGQA